MQTLELFVHVVYSLPLSSLLTPLPFLPLSLLSRLFLSFSLSPSLSLSLPSFRFCRFTIDVRTYPVASPRCTLGPFPSRFPMCPASVFAIGGMASWECDWESTSSSTTDYSVLSRRVVSSQRLCFLSFFHRSCRRARTGTHRRRQLAPQ